MRAYQLGLYEKSMPNHLSLEEKLALTRACGYDHLELSVDETEEKLLRLDWTEEQIARVACASAAQRVPIRSICLSAHRRFPLGHPDPAVRQRGMDIMQKAIALAAQLGVRIIQLAGYDVYYEPGTEQTRKLFGENLQKAVEMAAGAGVTLAFETMEQDFLNTVSKAMDWVNRIQSPYLQVYPDMGNITNAAKSYGTDVVEDMECGRGHLVAIHLKESRPGVFREVPYGQGHVDFAAVTRKGMELGVRLYLAEFWYMGQDTWKEDIVNNGLFLRAHLDEAAKAFVQDMAAT